MKLKTLKTQWEKHLQGGEKPRVEHIVKVKAETDAPIVAVMSYEIEDRDGEIVAIQGVKVQDMKAGVPLLDAHNMNGSVVNNVLGRAINLKREKINGVKALVAELSFAPTINGQVAEALVRGGYVDSVSIGFGVNQFNPETATIEKSELYELSLVSVPANPEAKIQVTKSVDLIEKSLANYKNIKPVVKQYRSLFLKDLAKELGLEKTGDELQDIKALYDLVTKQLQNVVANSEVENLPDTLVEETLKPKKVLSEKAKTDLVDKVVLQMIAKGLI